MMTLDCQHCGAKLALEGPSLPAEVRCKRCGRRTSTANAERARPASRKPEADPPTAEPRPTRMPPPSYPPPDVRVPPEEVFPRPKPRPGFYDSDSPLPDGKGKAIALIGGVLGVLVAFAAGAWWLLATSQPQTPFVGPATGASTIVAGVPAATDGQAPVSTAAQSSSPATRQNASRGASPGAKAAGETTPRPAAPTNVAPDSGRESVAGASGIEIRGDYLNAKVYAGSELALGTYDASGGALLDDKEINEALDSIRQLKPLEKGQFATWIETMNRSLDAASSLAAHLWHARNRPTLQLRFRNVREQGLSAEIMIRCKDKVSRDLIVGGTATTPSPARLMPDSDGNADVPLILRLEATNALRLAAPQQAHITIDIRMSKEGRLVDRLEVPHTITVYPTSFVEKQYPYRFGFAAMVDEDHPFVKELIAQVNSSPFCNRMKINLGSGGLDLPSVFAVWRELEARGIRYSSVAKTSDPDSQEVRPLAAALLGGNANCADGTCLIASLLRKAGLDVAMIFVPGHVFVGLPGKAAIYYDGQLDNRGAFDQRTGTWKRSDVPFLPIGLEATMLGSNAECSTSFRRAIREAMPELVQFEDSLARSDHPQWGRFLAAVEQGTLQIWEQYLIAINGTSDSPTDPESIYPLAAWADYLDKAMRGALKHEDGRELSEDETRQEILRTIRRVQGDYMRQLPIRAARAAGIRPIGCDLATLPKDGIGPLKAK